MRSCTNWKPSLSFSICNNVSDVPILVLSTHLPDSCLLSTPSPVATLKMFTIPAVSKHLGADHLTRGEDRQENIVGDHIATNQLSVSMLF